MITGVCDACVEDIRERIYLILDGYGDLSYDYHHIRRVEAECASLATQRGLNVNIAEIIGLLHDAGRIIGQVSGKDHSRESGRIASIWLKEYPIEVDDFDSIVDAVMMHNHKKKIGAPYEELIKDADSLAHGIEFPGYLSIHEEIRNKASRQAQLHFGLMPISQVNERLQKDIKALFKTIKNLDPNHMTGKDVHALRVNIRSIRSIISLLRGTSQWEGNKQLNSDLKVIFKSFETSRKLTVFRKSLKAAGIHKKYYNQIRKDIDTENERAARKLAKRCKLTSSTLKNIQMEALPQKAMVSAFNLKVNQYKNSLVTSDVQDMDNIHDIRIKGKLLKYLLDSQIVTMHQNTSGDHQPETTEDMHLINKLHNCMGILNDLEENERLYVTYFESGKNHLPNESRVRLKQFYSSQKKYERKRLKVLIFHMRKRLCV